MATYDSLAALFTATANAIRAKLGVSSTFSANEFPSKIASIPTGVQMTVNKNLIITRSDVSSAPSNTQMFVKYPYVNSNDEWGTVVEELVNGGSITIPIPDMDFVTNDKISNEDMFFIFFIKPATESPCGIFYYSDSRTTSGLVARTVDIGGGTSSSAQAGYIAIHTDMSELSAGTATLGVFIQGR